MTDNCKLMLSLNVYRSLGNLDSSSGQVVLDVVTFVRGFLVHYCTSAHEESRTGLADDFDYGSSIHLKSNLKGDKSPLIILDINFG